MRAVRMGIAVIMTIAAVGGTARAQAGHDHHATTPQGDAARVEAAVRALFAAAERGDFSALDTLYAGDSLTVIEGAGLDRGWANYRDHHLMPEMKEMKNFRYAPADIMVHVSGDMAWVHFRYSLRADMGGRAIDNVGRGTAILERRGSRWVVRHTQTAGRARRPSDPA